ncbi:hypothetical protein N1851_020146 [Merluccius polli]|uniref:Uncharacterized protein n=1 Tax=Merluccius polli TaxID=89951 RepID=A0AA47MLB3_MERPO|nr:hypothetical protein N1851_020146 [Merluccius polli]
MGLDDGMLRPRVLTLKMTFLQWRTSSLGLKSAHTGVSEEPQQQPLRDHPTIRAVHASAPPPPAALERLAILLASASSLDSCPAILKITHKPFAVTTCPECCEECADGVVEVRMVGADSVVTVLRVERWTGPWEPWARLPVAPEADRRARQAQVYTYSLTRRG